MSAWGKTGRVTLGKKRTPSIDAERRVKVDGTVVGGIFYPRGEGSFPHFGAATGINHDYDYTEGLPSLDAAVLWVLRRVDPALWRQERGEVWTVKRVPRVPGPPPWFGFPWQVINPAGVMVNAVTAMYAEVAIEDAARRAHAKAALR